MPPEPRVEAIRHLAAFPKPGGVLLVIARGRSEGDDPGIMPMPLLARELRALTDHGLVETGFEDFLDTDGPPQRRSRAAYRRLE